VCVALLGLSAVLGYAPPAHADTNCLNTAARVGFSANLPDCRAYELVTPPNMNGLSPTAIHIGSHNPFDTWLASPLADSVIFNLGSGSLPGFNGNGVYDQYQALRGSDGWTTRLVAPSGAESEGPHPGGVSLDHGYSFWNTFAEDRGSLQVEDGAINTYIRLPSGTMEPIGRGSLGDDFLARGRWISAGGNHVIFTSSKPLEPDAPPEGQLGIYDRKPGGTTHVVSLLPGDVTPSSEAFYQGTSADGSTIAFSVGKTLYLRQDLSTTMTVADESSVPIGTTLKCNATAEPSEGATLLFQWLRNSSPIEGATSSSYTTTTADSGAPLQCQAFALTSNTGATQVGAPAVVVAPSSGIDPPKPPTNLPNLLPASPTAGTIETCATGIWEGSPSFTYRWYSDGAVIPGATSSTYEVTAEDVPSSLQCAVTGTNSAGSVTRITRVRATSPAPSPPASIVAPSVSVNTEAVFGGLSDDGDRMAYLQVGDIFIFDASAGETTRVTTGGSASIVNFSPDGSHLYFIDTQQLDGSAGTPGEPNLYAWDGSDVSFIATVAANDVTAFDGHTSQFGLGQWPAAVGPLTNENAFGRGRVPARTTPDGSVLVFQSHASLTAYDSGGLSQIYRYDTVDESLLCVSCHPAGTPATWGSELQTAQGVGSGNPASFGSPTTPLTHIANVTSEGDAVFFETSDSLVARDIDGLQDVYRWKSGDIALISWGESGTHDYLYGMTPDGNNVFFATNDTLVPQDLNGNSRKIYDARVAGGFPLPVPRSPCDGDGCQGPVGTPPALPAGGSGTFSGPADPTPRRARKCKLKRGKHHKRKCIKKRRQRTNRNVRIDRDGLK
jgi:hypothetical protein